MVHTPGMATIEQRPTSTLDKIVRDATDNRIVAFVLDHYYADVHPASSIYDMTVRELLAEVRELKAA